MQCVKLPCSVSSVLVSRVLDDTWDMLQGIYDRDG
jgi:hypothetical protein